MIKRVLFVCVLLAFFQSAMADTKRILFIGNSYCYVNDLPNTLRKIALSLGDTLVVDNYTPGGYSFSAHANDANTLAKIQQGNWDYVVLQAQSQEPSFSPQQVQNNTYPYAAILDSLIHVYNPCAETLFYMTWGRKNGDASNCAAYPPICTYAGMQQRLRESYLEMTQDNHASVAPVGVSWKTCRATYPNLELYQTDESHPSETGTYLAACTFYSSIYHKSALNADTVFASIGSGIAQNIQNLCFHTVMDSIENWQQYGDLPLAQFTATTTNLTAQFTDASMRNTTWFWDFGDGTNSTQQNPSKTYINAGAYAVTLTVSDSCLQDQRTQMLTVGQPSSVTKPEATLPIVRYDSGYIEVLEGKDGLLMVYQQDGKVLLKQKISASSSKIAFQPGSTGIYYYQIHKQGKNMLSGNWLIKY